MKTKHEFQICMILQITFWQSLEASSAKLKIYEKPKSSKCPLRGRHFDKSTRAQLRRGWGKIWKCGSVFSRRMRFSASGDCVAMLWGRCVMKMSSRCLCFDKLSGKIAIFTLNSLKIVEILLKIPQKFSRVALVVHQQNARGRRCFLSFVVKRNKKNIFHFLLALKLKTKVSLVMRVPSGWDLDWVRVKTHFRFMINYKIFVIDIFSLFTVCSRFSSFIFIL